MVFCSALGVGLFETSVKDLPQREELVNGSRRKRRQHTSSSSTSLPTKPERVVIIEFPDMDALNTWYNAPEYQPLIALRKRCTSDLDMMFTLEGA
jgi:hypothetical protein